LELGPNTVRPTPEIWGLVGELGLSDAALLAPPGLPRYVALEGRLHGLAPGPATLLTTRLLSARGKLRVLREPFVRAGDDPRETVASFFARRLGIEVATRLVAPFVSGIWAGDADTLSARSAFPELARWEREHGSLFRGALASRPPRDASRPKGLLSFRDGLETLPRALAASLGERLSRGTPVRRLWPEAGRWRVETERESLAADRVVLATPAAEAARLLRDIDPRASRALSEGPQPPLAVLHLAWPAGAFAAPLAGFGHLVVPSLQTRILGAVWSSCLFPGRAPRDEVLLTAFAGGSRDPAAAALPDDELLDLAARELSAALGARAAPRVVRVTRYARAIPQYDGDHASRMAAVEEAERGNPGLTLIGNYRGGISVGDVVRNGLAASDPDS
jgi:oxygen-dependent protoporphyrinogen oxidase